MLKSPATSVMIPNICALRKTALDLEIVCLGIDLANVQGLKMFLKVFKEHEKSATF